MGVRSKAVTVTPSHNFRALRERGKYGGFYQAACSLQDVKKRSYKFNSRPCDSVYV